MSGLKLNLGCGDKRLNGYINIDKYDTFEPDVVLDLERTPWPFHTDSVSEIQLIHVLEHLGQSSEVFLDIMKEMYRVCRHGARIAIAVPHPRSDTYLGDPTHVRPITVHVMRLFSKRLNRHFMEEGYANTPLALHLDVDFRIASVNYTLSERWLKKLRAGEIDEDGLNEAMETYNNVVDEIVMELDVVKTA